MEQLMPPHSARPQASGILIGAGMSMVVPAGVGGLIGYIIAPNGKGASYAIVGSLLATVFVFASSRSDKK